MRKIVSVAVLLSCFIATTGVAADLLIKVNGKQQTLNADALLKRTDAKSISIPLDPAYKKPMQYRAIPLTALLQEKGITSDDSVNFVALDGFTASLPATVLFNPSKAEPWLAIETATSAWPALSTKSKASAGPFYVVWTDPQAEGITQEQWPFQVTRVEEVDAIEKRFPMLLPDKSIADNSPIRQGFEVYKKNCLVCHKLNGGGDSNLGPDLNVPHNPTEYFQVKYLKMLIRNPSQVRAWPDSKMPGFGVEVISDGELDSLINYLLHTKIGKKNN